MRPPVVYKCILPNETSFMASNPSEKTAQTLPYPAWPYIDDPHVPCCLPTLLYARYFVHRSTDTESKKATAIAKKYLSRREDIEREISEQAQAFVKAQDLFWRPL